MKRLLLLAAVALVLLANARALIAAWQNRREPRGGTVELTERELRLEPMPGESTVTLLRIEWDALTDTPRDQRQPRWLDERKLTELGFDCSLSATNPTAGRHYGSLPAKPVFLVLEYEGEAWREARPQGKTTTRLFVVDAGLDVSRLRERYADRTRHILVRGLVRPFLQEREGPDERRLAEPRIRGWVQGLLPDQVFVPRPHNRVLRLFQSHEVSGREESEHEPRYAVTVSWGANYEPWVTAIRPLVPATPSKNAE